MVCGSKVYLEAGRERLETSTARFAPSIMTPYTRTKFDFKPELDSVAVVPYNMKHQSLNWL